MKQLFTRKMVNYSFVTFVIVFMTGGLLFPFTTNPYMLIIILSIECVVLLLVLLYFYKKYVRPIDKATETMEKLLRGDYHTRIHSDMSGSVGELNMKINALARNLSELKIQEQIQAEQLSTVIENSESGLVLIDEKGYIHLVNRKLLKMFGGQTTHYIGRLYYDVLKEETIHMTIQETYLREENVKSLFSINKLDEKTYFEIVGAPIFNDYNILKGVVLAVYDISEFKRVERMRKDFVANVSHELKTPITSIRGFSETLLDAEKTSEETTQKFLSIIFEESKRIQYLIEDLLVLSTLEKDAFSINIQPIHIGTLVKEMMPIISAAAEKKNIQLSTMIETENLLEADEEKLKQVLINLLTNAISYTPEKGHVCIRVTEKASSVCFEITDTGIGISKEYLPRIFERFYRVDKDRSRNTGGTGLGLAIVRHIVEAHDGKIEVESERGKGTTFKVNLPKNGKGKMD